MIAPIVVNFQPWRKGYFKAIGNISISDKEKKVDYGFWDVINECFVDEHGNRLSKVPQYQACYGLGSYGVIGKLIQELLNEKIDNE